MRGLRAVALLTIVFTCAGLAGCWDRRELNNIAFVFTMGVSRASNGDFLVGLQIPIPRKLAGRGGGGAKGGGAEQNSLVRTTQGPTVDGAIRKLGAVLGRSLSFGHCDVIIVKDDIAKDGGLASLLDFISRFWEFRRQTIILVSSRDPVEILLSSPELETTLGENLAKTVQEAIHDSSVCYISTVREILERQSILGAHVVLGRVDLVNDPDGNRTSIVEGAAVFERNRLIGFLDGDETRGLNIILNHIRGSALSLDLTAGLPADGEAGPTPGYHAGERDNKSPDAAVPRPTVSVFITRFNSKTAARLEGGQPVIDIKINVTGQVTEASYAVPLQSSQGLSALNNALAKRVEGLCRAAIVKTQSFPVGCDVFFFSEAIHDRFPAVWAEISDRWDEYYKTLKVNVIVNANIIESGMACDPISPHR